MKFKLALYKHLSYLFLLTFFINVPTNVFATYTPWQPYVGIGLGHNTLSIESGRHEENGGVATSKSNFSKSSLVVPLYVGINKKLTNNFTIGGEIYGYFDNTSMKNNNILHDPVTGTQHGRSESIKRHYVYGLKVKGSYYINSSTNAFIGAGIEKSNVEYRAFNIDTNDYLKQRKSLYGLPLSVGTEIEISTKSKLKLEYTHSIYKTWNTGNIGSTHIEVIKIKPSSSQFMVGLSYLI